MVKTAWNTSSTAAALIWNCFYTNPKDGFVSFQHPQKLVHQFKMEMVKFLVKCKLESDMELAV